MKRIAFALGTFLLTVFRLIGADLDDLEGSVVNLKCIQPATANVGGKTYEIWLKNPNTGEFLQQTNMIFGTGFIVKGKKLPFIVTAKHVATDMHSNCEVIVRGPANMPVSVKLIDLFVTSGGSPPPQMFWCHHESADCSVHPICPNSPGFSKLSHIVAVPMGLLSTEPNAPPRNELLTTFGFALGYGTQLTFSPITKESKPASGLMSENSVQFFLLQDPGIDGFSGAPFFKSGEPRVIALSPAQVGTVSGGLRCWGLLSRTDSDRSGGKMARVIHSRHIVEVIEKLEATLPEDFQKPADSQPKL